MVTIEYSIGNGYSCPCCRISDEEIETFDSEEQAFEECLKTARRKDWDFSVLNVSGAQDNDALEKRIDDAVDKAKKADINDKKIRDLEQRIKENRAWIENAPAETVRRQARIEEDGKALLILLQEHGSEETVKS